MTNMPLDIALCMYSAKFFVVEALGLGDSLGQHLAAFDHILRHLHAQYAQSPSIKPRRKFCVRKLECRPLNPLYSHSIVQHCSSNSDYNLAISPTRRQDPTSYVIRRSSISSLKVRQNHSNTPPRLLLSICHLAMVNDDGVIVVCLPSYS